MAKKPKKAASGKARKTIISDQSLPAEIEVKLYQLNETLATPFMRGGIFSFRLAFDRINGSEHKRYHRKKCPVINMTPADVLQVENETAQRMIEKMVVPTGTLRDGVARDGGNLFIDVTATETEYDIDLDEIFDAV